MTRVAVLEYARFNIRVNCICPGGIETEMAKRIRRGAEPDPKAVSRHLGTGADGRAGGRPPTWCCSSPAANRRLRPEPHSAP